MRDVKSIETKPLSFLSRMGWQVPVASFPQVVDLTTLATPTRQYLNRLRMRFVDFNSPGTVGYSVAICGWRVMAILSHKQDETTPASVYERDNLNGGDCCWAYMPVNQGEYLTDICRRAVPARFRSTVGITVGISSRKL